MSDFKLLVRAVAGAAAFLLLPTQAPAAPLLPALAASGEAVTASGLSAGGFMAVQFQVANSRLVRGVGILAGGPYYCAQGSLDRAMGQCMAPKSGSLPPTVAQQKQVLADLAKAGTIDSPEYLRKQRVWLFSGGQDHTVETSVMDALAAFYGDLLPASAVRYVKLPDAGHAMISLADPQPNACGSSEPPFINRCRNFDAAGELLAHLLGSLHTPGSSLDGEMLAFDQRPFVDGNAVDASMAEEGYAFVPRSCRNGGCRVHVVFHGCRQGASEAGRRFVDGAGYNAWADNNRLIVLYPQVMARSGPALGSWQWVLNPKGCWDWWGYSGREYHTRNGAQIKAVKAMIDRLAGPLPAK